MACGVERSQYDGLANRSAPQTMVMVARAASTAGSGMRARVGVLAARLCAAVARSGRCTAADTGKPAPKIAGWHGDGPTAERTEPEARLGAN